MLRKRTVSHPPPPPPPNITLGYKGISIAIWETKDTLDCPPAPELCAFPTGQSVLDYLEFDGGNKELLLNVVYLVSFSFNIFLITNYKFQVFTIFAIYINKRSGIYFVFDNCSTRRATGFFHECITNYIMPRSVCQRLRSRSCITYNSKEITNASICS